MMMSWSHLFSHEQCITFLWSIQKPKSIMEHNPCAVLKILYLIWCSIQKWPAFQYVLKTFDRPISLPNLRFFLSTCFLSIRTGFAFLFGTDWLQASLIWARAPQLLSEKKCVDHFVNVHSHTEMQKLKSMRLMIKQLRKEIQNLW